MTKIRNIKGVKYEIRSSGIAVRMGGANPSNDSPDDSKRVDACNVEFGYELISALPYAYHLHQKGLLMETISAVDTGCLYYFSPRHLTDGSPRGWHNMEKAARLLPNTKIHQPSLDWSKFSPPPLKEQYKNDRFVFDKPTICICNRVNVEWKRDVINYFDIDVLEKLFKSLKKKYQIIYFNIEGRKEFYDGVEPVSIGDFDLARKHGAVVIHDLHKDNPDLSFNTVQLMVMANCEAFITMNGGYSILASYMGGTNIIYSKECREIGETVNSFYRWYHRFGGSRIVHVDNYTQLLNEVDIQFIRKVPLVNVLTRTHNRPNYFRDCYNSVMDQTYENIRMITLADNPQRDTYLIPYQTSVVDAEPTEPKQHRVGDEYGIYFPFNGHLNTLVKHVNNGWVILLDDDDEFVSIDAIDHIMSHITSEDDMVLWRVRQGERIIPSDENFGKNIVPKDISGIGLMCHSKHIKQHYFEPYRRADYRLIKWLSERLTVKWVGAVLTGTQSGNCNMGNRSDK
jgi:hypothetical protein